MKVGISGSRSILDPDVFKQALDDSPWEVDAIVTGNSDGVDTSAKLFAEKNNIPIDIIEADYAKLMNAKIAKNADVLVAVWDGSSNGTRDTIDRALDRSVPVYVHIVD